MPDPLDPPPNGSGGTDPLDPSSGSGSNAALGLYDTCNILRKGPRVSDGQGSATAAYPILYAAVPCRLVKAKLQHEVVQAGVLVAVATWTLSLPLGTDLRPADQVNKDTMLYQIVDTNLGETNAPLLSAVVIRVNR